MSTQETMPADVARIVGDFAIACEARCHRGDQSACWIVWQYVCCPARPPVGLVCHACLCRYLYGHGNARCRNCGTTRPMRECITRFRPLDLPGSA